MKNSEQEYEIELSKRDSLLSLSGRNGTIIYGGTDAVEDVNYSAMSIREEGTTFTSLTCVGDGHDLDETHFYRGGATPEKGDLLVPPPGYHINAFELASGSVIVT